MARNRSDFGWHCDRSADGYETRRGALHGVDSGVGWTVHPAALVRFTHAHRVSLIFIEIQEPSPPVHLRATIVEHYTSNRPADFVSVDYRYFGTEAGNMGY